MEPQKDAPSLSLQILNGPRKGETFQFEPGNTVKIGRVVRGNNLPIKDPGISTKHLSIQIDSGNWILRDLDSSNGTVLDSATVTPNTPFHLRDGSTIKIGEVTSIVVYLVKPQNDDTGNEVEEKPIQGKRKNNEGVSSRVTVQSVDGVESGNVVQPEPTRVTRNTRSKQKTVTFSGLSIEDSEAPEEKVEELKKNARVTRNAKNKKNVIGISELSTVDLDVVGEKVEERKNARVTRNSKNKPKVVEVSESSIGDLDVVEEKVEEQKSARVTRNSKNKGIVIGENSSLADGVVDVEKKKTRGGAKGKKKLQEECVDDGDGKGKEDGVVDVEKKRTTGGAKGKKLQEECVDDGDGKDIIDEKDKENLNKDDNWPDLNKISIGEWFDFLDVYLPKQINDEIEETIASMRQKAERLREYVIMYQNQRA